MMIYQEQLRQLSFFHFLHHCNYQVHQYEKILLSHLWHALLTQQLEDPYQWEEAEAPDQDLSDKLVLWKLPLILQDLKWRTGFKCKEQS